MQVEAKKSIISRGWTISIATNREAVTNMTMPMTKDFVAAAPT